MTLVEVMVAVTVFSIGLLAVASLQVNGMRHTQIATMRMEANMAALNIIEEMRANKAAKFNNYSDYVGRTSALVTDQTSCMDDNTDCDAQAIADFSLKRWFDRLGNILPNGEGAICIDSTLGDMRHVSGSNFNLNCDGLGDRVAVKISWKEKNPPGKRVSSDSWQHLEMEAGF